MHALFLLGLLLSAALLSLGAVRLYRAIATYRFVRREAAYRAAELHWETQRIVRAAQHRAAEREWGRVPA